MAKKRKAKKKSTPKAPERPEVDLEALEADDIRNLMARVDAGQPLTGPQWQRLMAYGHGLNPNTPAKVTNIAALCGALGISRTTFYNHRSKKGAPKKATNGEYDVELWRKYLVTHGVIEPGPAAQAETPPDEDETPAQLKQKLEIEKLRHQAGLLSIKHRKEMGEVVDVEVIVEWIHENIGGLRKRLMAIPGSAANRLANRKPEYIQKHLKKMLADALEQSKTEFDPTLMGAE